MNVVAINRPDPTEGKLPAFDSNAEVATLAACMTMPECAALAMSIASPEDFYERGHQEIARAIVALLESGDETTGTNVAIRLRETGKMRLVGDDSTLMDLINSCASVGTIITRYAGKVRDLAQVRRLATTLRMLLAECYEPIPNVSGFMGRVDALVGEATRTSRGGGITTGLEGAKEVARALSSVPPANITTGFASLDKVTTGFERGALYILAARAGMGKTAMAMQMAVAAAAAGHRVLVVSLEMPRMQIIRRIICGMSKVPMQAIRDRQVTPNQFSAFTHAASDFAKLPLLFSDSPAQGLLDVKAGVRTHKPALLVVDHIGLLRPAAGSRGSSRSREQEVAEFSRGLKALALEEKMPVLALCQVNREVAKAARRPSMSDLRESGAIEQDADGIWLIHRPGYYDRKAGPEVQREAELIVAKQRDGATGWLPLQWDAPEFSVPYGNDGTDMFGS